MNVCRRQAPCAFTVLLPGENPATAKWLKQLEGKASERQSSSHGAWSEQHMRDLQSLGCRIGQGVPAHVNNSPWFHTLSRREQSCLEHAIKSAPNLFMADVSQTLGRTRHSIIEHGHHLAPTMLPIQLMWIQASQLRVYGQPCGRLLLGREAFLIQGFPITKAMELLESISEEHLRIIEGNSVGRTVVLAILMATFAAVDWRVSLPSASMSDDAQVMSAMQAFAILGSNEKEPSMAKRQRKCT